MTFLLLVSTADDIARSVARADAPQLTMAPTPEFVRPLRVMGVRLNSDGTLTPTTEWMDVMSYPAGGGTILDCWDAFGIDCRGNLNGGDECGLPGPEYRWFFGPNYVQGFYATNWQAGNDGRTGASKRVAFAWFMNSGDTFLYALFTGKESRADCGGYTVDYSGVIYDFGYLPGGAFMADINLSGIGLSHILDSDGDGSVVIILAQSFNGMDFVLSPYSQCLLWGSDATWDGVPLVGTQNGIVYSETGCWDWHFGVCPDPLGPMIGFGDCVSGCSSDGCLGTETLSVKAKNKAGKCQVKAILKNGKVGGRYGFVMPTGQCRSAVANDRGKAVVKEYPSRPGNVSVETCGRWASVCCP